MLASAFALVGCGTVDLFGQYDLPESPGVADAPWPRLADVPAAPPVGSYTAEVPDPAQGAATQRDLAAAAVVADVRRDALSGPVITDAERARLLRNAKREQP